MAVRIPLLPPQAESVLFPGRLAAHLAAATVLATAYWYLGTPGPQLGVEGGDWVRDLDAGVRNVGWAVILYALVPGALLLLTGDSLREAGLRLGDPGYGLRAWIVVSAIFVPVMYAGAGDPAVQATYPWAGTWVGASPANLATWLAISFWFYFAFELFFRGFIVRAIAPHWGVGAAIWVQAFAATAAHFGKPLPETLAALPASLLFGLMAVRSRSILYNVLLHFVIGASTDLFALYHQGLLLP